MHRRRPNRLFALIWAFIFLLSSAGEVVGVHSAAHHGPSEDGSATAFEAGSEHSGHHASHHRQDSQPDAPEGHAGQCTCYFVCGATSGILLGVTTPTTALLVVEVSQPVGFSPTSTNPLRRLPPHFLPHANGPPAQG